MGEPSTQAQHENGKHRHPLLALPLNLDLRIRSTNVQPSLNRTGLGRERLVGSSSAQLPLPRLPDVKPTSEGSEVCLETLSGCTHHQHTGRGDLLKGKVLNLMESYL